MFLLCRVPHTPSILPHWNLWLKTEDRVETGHPSGDLSLRHLGGVLLAIFEVDIRIEVWGYGFGCVCVRACMREHVHKCTFKEINGGGRSQEQHHSD